MLPAHRTASPSTKKVVDMFPLPPAHRKHTWGMCGQVKHGRHKGTESMLHVFSLPTHLPAQVTQGGMVQAYRSVSPQQIVGLLQGILMPAPGIEAGRYSEAAYRQAECRDRRGRNRRPCSPSHKETDPGVVQA
jgi:hypothetical protein